MIVSRGKGDELPFDVTGHSLLTVVFPETKPHYLAINIYNANRQKLYIQIINIVNSIVPLLLVSPTAP